MGTEIQDGAIHPHTGPVQMAPQIGAEHVGQSTAIEQSRAVAEVLAAMQCAQSFPRDERAAVARVKAACDRHRFAEAAFFRFPRGGEVIDGLSVKFARELARCWGGVQYGIVELSQDLDKGESECMAYSWDLQTNTRNEIRFQVPHWRHTRQGKRRLTDPRDIYETVANNGARRLRQTILAIIPDDVVQDAADRCRHTIKHGDGRPLDQRIAAAVKAFGDHGVNRAMMAEYLGKKPESMDVAELADLQVIYNSIKQGEPVDNFFAPPQAKMAAEIPKDNTVAAPAAEKLADEQPPKRRRGRPRKNSSPKSAAPQESTATPTVSAVAQPEAVTTETSSEPTTALVDVLPPTTSTESPAPAAPLPGELDFSFEE